MRLVIYGFELINLLVDFGRHGVVHMHMYIIGTCRLLHRAKKIISLPQDPCLIGMSTRLTE